jgi:hypothetical protein
LAAHHPCWLVLVTLGEIYELHGTHENASNCRATGLHTPKKSYHAYYDRTYPTPLKKIWNQMIDEDYGGISTSRFFYKFIIIIILIIFIIILCVGVEHSLSK